MYLTKNILYHGTIKPHDIIDLSKCKKFGDFGAGYYLTTLYKQAFNWGKNKSHGKCDYYIYQYKFQLPLTDNIKELSLLTYNKEWLDIIAYCRTYGTIPEDIKKINNIRNPDDYDIVYDRMADNIGSEISNCVSQYIKKEISVNKILPIISKEWAQPRDQYCFKTSKAISLLKREQTLAFDKNNKLKYRD
ncbi:DUF3990 domain-containing protein (plasmid) [Megamonas funiformis]|uniref:DUF3990 domain-containing protein n=1 Tax=Megamonas funiformis YIT 11815 TaxID=742816 RepID=A0ABN0EF31_9FIRM|nr:DUF3990 domain-containing protein [Megamonas funiformis]EHR31825.1 hypothetical protein HMPREF9454_02481 [Megamonas funiformis YIT 11815]QIB61253.1 DUF3990 domain-containing protein [Megamonas funiformis]